jgi:hypothetical protein
VHGKAEVNWDQMERRNRYNGSNRTTTDMQSVHYHSEEVYLNTKTYLMGFQGKQAEQIPAGTHRFTFEALLPDNIPASFKGSYGKIEYNVEACLDVPWRFDKKYKVIFIVGGNDNLNEQPDLKIPMENEKFTRFCCLFCKSDPLTVTVTIPRGGFIPDEEIPVTINYVNTSDVKVDRTKIELKQIVNFNR